MPFQEAAIPMLEPDRVLKEMKALQTHFKSKRDYVLGRLKELGFKIKNVPDSTFYIWLDLSDLPKEINDGLNFFQKCLEEKVIGEYSCKHHITIRPRLTNTALFDSCTRYFLRSEPCQEKRSV